MDIRRKKILDRLAEEYPAVECALNYETSFQLAVAVILSAQCTDARVNTVTPDLFRDHKTAYDFSQIPLVRLEKYVFSTGFYRNKAKNIQALAKIIDVKYQGGIPNDMNILITLPGIGRKTANVLQQEIYHEANGVVVDTHCLRNSYRLGFGKDTKNAEIQERQLMKILPKKKWFYFSHWMILLGRSYCTARSPKCHTCILRDYCPKKGL
ncbi:endonuclease III [Candidatus Peregrinibacteria bacterium]|nr:MAG: endonuclease III [Candidatus Peregrinibacteria bacterium]